MPDAHPPSLSLSDFTPRESEHPAARRAHIGNGTCSRVYSGHSSSVLSVRLPHTHGPVCPPRAVQYTLVPTCVYSVTAYPHQTPPQKHECLGFRRAFAFPTALHGGGDGTVFAVVMVVAVAVSAALEVMAVTAVVAEARLGIYSFKVGS